MNQEIPTRTPEVFRFLKRGANDMRTVTYGEIGQETGLAAIGVGPQLNF